jgi:hypothetical protein
MIEMNLRFDLARLSRICVGLLVALVVAELIFAADSYGMLQFLDAMEAGFYSDAELAARAEQVDARAGLIGIGYLVVYVVCATFSAVWIYRASWNSRQLQPDVKRITPGWAIGWFFVPVMSLWMPYRAMKQTWNSSHYPTGDIAAPMPGFALLWWLSWVATSIAGNLSFRLSTNAETIDDFRTAANVDLLIAPFAILTAILFIRLIKSITTAQTGKRPGTDLKEFSA